MAAVGTVDLTAPGTWLVAVQGTLTLTGTDLASVDTGLPYLTVDVSPGSHGSFCVLPSTTGVVPWAWSFLHEVTSTSVSESSPETLSFDGTAANLGTLALNVALAIKGVFIAIPEDDGTPEATAVRINPGSKLQILRSVNR